MVDASDNVFGGSIPDIYDELLVPLIFDQYADDLAARTSELDPGDVLEVAAGSGVVSRAVAAVLDPASRYVATDLNAPMLDRGKSMHDDPDRIVWKPADASALPFHDDTFDLVLCQFGVMFFPDRVQAYKEAFRVLRMGGTFVFSMWDRLEENEFAFEVTEALAEIYSDDPPNFLARTPHGHYDTTIYHSELGEAGFDNVTVETVERVSVASSATVPAVAYCQGTPLRNEIEVRTGPDLKEATAHATHRIRQRFGDGEVQGRIRGFIITASP